MCDLEQRGPDPPTLRRWQDVEVIDPTFSKRDEANKLGTFEAAPHLARLENVLSEKPSILLGSMQDRDPWQSAVTGAALNNSCSIHVVKGQPLQHAFLPGAISVAGCTNLTRPKGPLRLILESGHLAPYVAIVQQMREMFMACNLWACVTASFRERLLWMF